MEEVLYQENFPAFPSRPEDLQKLSVVLRSQRVLTKEDWDKLKSENTDPVKLVQAIALRNDVKPKNLAEAEASILNVPFIDLETTNIPNEVLKLFKPEQMVEHRVIPVKINGQELLVGMLAPANEEILKTLGQTTTMAMRPGKVLWEPLQKKIRELTEKKKPAAPGKKGPRKRLGDIIVESKYATEEQMKEAIEGAKKEKLRLGAYLVKKGTLSNKQLSIALSKQFDIPYIDLEESLVDPVLATLLPKKLCYEHILCPVKKEDNKIVIAMTDPTDIITIDHIEMMTGMRLSPVVSSELSIISALDKLYGETADALADQVGNKEESNDLPDDLAGDLNENAAPIIKLVNLVLTQAAQTGTSDIHIEPFEHEVKIRFRKDGMMKMFMNPNKAAHAAIVSRIKVMSNLDIAETRLPQDGRIKMTLGSRRVDLRVSCVPCVWGEKVCMRLLDQGNLKVNLNDLGFEPRALEHFMEGVKSPNGIVLVTGPTGSGKTTTLYSCLHLLNNPALNIMTAEDPVEYNLMGINQVQCHADIGLDFAAALRSFLRQDPNVIMIGEIRDFETANIAIKAAMTGHLVISTLHTNDAPSTIARLMNMGIEPFGITTSIRVVQAQRLVRKICKSCYTEYKPGADLIQTLKINAKLLQKLGLEKDIDLNNLTLAKGAGCPDCDQSGCKGRIGVYEVLPMSQAFREVVERRGTPEELRRQALKDGMLSLRESAMYKLLTKRTTVEEIYRTTMEAGDLDEEALEKEIVKKKGKIGAQANVIEGGAGVVASVPEIGGLMKEMESFRTTLDRLAGGPARIESINGELLRQNLTDPLAQLQTQVSAGMAGQADLSKLLPSIQAQSQKMDFNLRNLTWHFSTLELKPTPVDIAQFLEKNVLSQLKQHVLLARILSGKPTIGQGLKITKNFAPGLPPIVVDPEALRAIAVNLTMNSLMAFSTGGELKLVSRLKPQTTNRVEVVFFDNGAGIPTESQPELFTPFAPIGRPTLGLGLAISRKLVQAMNGQISIKSTPGANTLVVLDFPIASS